MRAFKNFLNLTDKVFEVIGMVFLVAMILIISLQVATRQLLSFTPHWSEEVALILMIWFGFIGIALGVKRGIHISIEYFVGLMPQGVKKVISKLENLLICSFGAFFMIYGSRLVSYTSTSTLPATQWSSSTIYLMVPVTGVMIILYSLEKLFSNDMKEASIEQDYQ